MDLSKYLELGFKSQDEMLLYIDVFGGKSTKSKEPDSLEELLKNLEDEHSIIFVQKTKQNYDEEIKKDEAHPKLIKMSLGQLLHRCYNFSEIDRLISIWSYYTELGKTKEYLYDEIGNTLLYDFLENADSFTDNEINKLFEIRKTHIIGKYYPYRNIQNAAQKYLLTRVKGLDKSSQDKFLNYIGNSILQAEESIKKNSIRDKAFVEVMSQNARIQDENIAKRKEERYQSMIDELDEAQEPPFKK